MPDKKRFPFRFFLQTEKKEERRLRERRDALEKKRITQKTDMQSQMGKMKDPNNVVEIEALHTSFFSKKAEVKAVDGISFEIPKHRVVALVGESGCGKTAVALSLMQLLPRPQGQVAGGSIRFQMGNGDAIDIAKASNAMMEKLRGTHLSMVFQEPMNSLNPVCTIGNQIEEAIFLQGETKDKATAKARALELLALVGIPDREAVYQMYPHELSGGMKQRVLIAIALSSNPELLIADEPTTALDVTIQAQILALLEELKEKVGASILLITHDLGIAATLADDIVVMYAGHIVEKGKVEEIFHHPSHPYTLGLLKSRPALGKRQEMLYSIPGSVPRQPNALKGCPFFDRCERRTKGCSQDYPKETVVLESHQVFCHHPLSPKEDLTDE